MANAVTDASFEKDVGEDKGYVLIDFWAPWCGPCRQLSPVIDEVAKDMGNKVKVLKMNIDENPDTASRKGVRSIPALMLFKDGQLVSNKVGSMPKSTIIDWLNSEIG